MVVSRFSGSPRRVEYISTQEEAILKVASVGRREKILRWMEATGGEGEEEEGVNDNQVLIARAM